MEPENASPGKGKSSEPNLDIKLADVFNENMLLLTVPCPPFLFRWVKWSLQKGASTKTAP